MQLCLFCEGSGICPEASLPAEGPSYYSMGEPPVWQPEEQSEPGPQPQPEDPAALP